MGRCRGSEMVRGRIEILCTNGESVIISSDEESVMIDFPSANLDITLTKEAAILLKVAIEFLLGEKK